MMSTLKHGLVAAMMTVGDDSTIGELVFAENPVLVSFLPASIAEELTKELPRHLQTNGVSFHDLTAKSVISSVQVPNWHFISLNNTYITTLHVENVHNHQFNSSQLLKNTKFTTQCMCPETTKLFHKLEFLFYAICFIAVVNLQS